MQALRWCARSFLLSNITLGPSRIIDELIDHWATHQRPTHAIQVRRRSDLLPISRCHWHSYLTLRVCSFFMLRPIRRYVAHVYRHILPSASPFGKRIAYQHTMYHTYENGIHGSYSGGVECVG